MKSLSAGWMSHDWWFSTSLQLMTCCSQVILKLNLNIIKRNPPCRMSRIYYFSKCLFFEIRWVSVWSKNISPGHCFSHPDKIISPPEKCPLVMTIFSVLTRKTTHNDETESLNDIDFLFRFGENISPSRDIESSCRDESSYFANI